MPKIVHFNSHDHRANRKDGGTRRVLVFRKTRTARPVKAREVRFSNASGRFVYDPQHPLACGAVAWVEFDSGVVVPVAPEPGVTCAAEAPRPRPPAPGRPRRAGGAVA